MLNSARQNSTQRGGERSAVAGMIDCLSPIPTAEQGATKDDGSAQHSKQQRVRRHHTKTGRAHGHTQRRVAREQPWHVRGVTDFHDRRTVTGMGAARAGVYPARAGSYQVRK